MKSDNSVKKQAVWLFAGTIFAAVVQLAQLGVIARSFDTRELGILAIINAVLMVAMVLQDMGMSSYLVHRQAITKREQSTIFWVNVFFGLATGVFILLLAYPLSVFYNMPELIYLFGLISLNFFILGAMSQYQAHFVKNKLLIFLARIEMFAKFISFLVTVALIYFAKFTVSAVIIGQFLNAFLRLLLMLIIGERSWHPTFAFCKTTFKSALHYGSYQLGSQTINQLRTQADTFIIGKFLGAEFLGIYSLAKELILQPLKLITPVINRLTLPRFAEKQHSGQELKELFLKSVTIIVNYSAVIYILIGLCAYIGVRVLYGSGHENVAELIPYMLLLGILRPMGGLTGAISQANGTTKKEFIWNIWAGIIVIIIVFASLLGSSLSLVAMSLSIAQVVMSIAVYPLFVRPVVGVTFKEYMTSWGGSALLSLIIVLCINYFNFSEWLYKVIL
ncbi:oligosaccharide flippase family protein [Serratia plymuthica]|uniref:oligosaccharide flippase family protein n=1 Tax=Serratia plymuthica TaxID=82996 RepID=UPI000456621F|nr:oligosaccharide flippase family protein [Serratia plymuthica]AHY06537.1 amylovoran biosynthesis protein AmsL [Serratia plymuthica]ANJ97883.1 amylovoran biosynthesis protein AmsL [Serratia plymuthica]UJD98496.1 oligosaccharide flippase family protein [Serratia plymuthica]